MAQAVRMEDPGPPIRIMVSSTRADLAAHRDAAAAVIEALRRQFETRVQILDRSMEKQLQSGHGEGPAAVSGRWVHEADWVVLIVGWNYGSLGPEGETEGLSFTEYEFTVARAEGKRIFMFMAADTLAGGAIDAALARWKDPADPHGSRLQRFRDALAERFFLDLFTSLDALRQRLEATLHAAIVKELLQRALAELAQLGDLIDQVALYVGTFADKVRLINQCKKVHDCLHQHLQQGVRPLREALLQDVARRKALGSDRVQIVQQALNMLLWCAGKLEAERDHLLPLVRPLAQPDDAALELMRNGLLLSLEVVLKKRPPWPAPLKTHRDQTAFSEQVEAFASELRTAFRLADELINTECGSLEKLYSGVMTAILDRPLDQDVRDRLRQCLAPINDMRGPLSAALTIHHQWQLVHDAVESRLSLLRGRRAGTAVTDASSWESSRAILVGLVHAEVERRARDAAAYEDFARRQHLPAAPDLACLQAALGDPPPGGDLAVGFEQILSPFYDTFWLVDKRTKQVVDDAQALVDKFLQDLNQLQRERHQAGPAEGIHP